MDGVVAANSVRGLAAIVERTHTEEPSEPTHPLHMAHAIRASGSVPPVSSPLARRGGGALGEA